MTIMKRSFLLTLLTLSLIFSSFPTNSTVSANGDFFSKKTEKSYAKLGPSLNSALKKDNINIKGLQRVEKDTERLHVYIEFSHPSVLDALGKLGKIKNLSEKYRLAEMFLPAKAIEGLLHNPHIISIREVMKPVVNRGYKLTEGFSDEGGHGIETYLKLNEKAGDGIKIGIISDGVNGLSDAIAQGEVPSDVVVLNNRFFGAEGTAMLEIVHDMAPNASLFFHDYGDSSLEFINAIDALVAQGVNIIIDDIVYLDEPFFEDSIIAKHIDQLVASTGLLYVSSAGNFATSHAQSAYAPLPSNDVYEHDFSPSQSGVQRMSITVPAYSAVLVMLQWNDPFNNSAKDLDLAVCPDPLTTYCHISDSYQLGAGYSPLEYIELYNTNSTQEVQYVTVYSETAVSNVTFEIYVFGGTVGFGGTRLDSTFGHSTAASVLSVASVSDPAYAMQSPYSSMGPFTMIDGTKRNKPDFTGTDCVSVSGSGGFGEVFCGTSAAAPHIGAIAALMWSNNRSLTRAQLIDAMKAKSFDLYTSGYDFQTGNGLIHLGLYGAEQTILKNDYGDFYFTFDKPGKFTVDNTSVLSLTSSLYQTNQVDGITYYTYFVNYKGLIDGSSTLRFTANDSSVLYRRKIVVSNRLTNFVINDPEIIYMPANQSKEFSVSLYPYYPSSTNFTYSSSNPAVATVDTSGRIQTKTIGETRVSMKHTATNLKESRLIRVGVLSNELTISPTSIYLYEGESVQLTATLSPADTTYKGITWSISNSSVASIDANGLVTANSVGFAQIRALSQDGFSYSYISVQVIEPLISIQFEKPKYTYYYTGNTITQYIRLIKEPSTSNEARLIWQSSNPGAITVDNQGQLTLTAVGTAEITVTGPNGIFASTMVHYEPQPYTNNVTVERNGVITTNAFKLNGTYGQRLSVDQMKEAYRQALGIPAGVDVLFYHPITYKGKTQNFAILSEYVFTKIETLYAIEMPVLIQSFKITDVSIEQNMLNVQGRFEPDRPFEIRYRYTISDPSVLRAVIDSGSSMCTVESVEFACTPGSFEILKAGSVDVTVESFDGSYRDTIRINITGETDNYQINDNVVQSLRVNSHNSNTLKLQWSAVSGALGYEILRSTALEGPYVKVAEVGSSDLTYLDGGRTVNQPMYYQVSAKLLLDDIVIQGPLSAVVEAKTKPDPITNGKITSESGTELKLEVNLNEPNALVQWAYARHPEGPFTELVESAQQIQSIAGLFPGQTYYFKVRYAIDTAYGRIYSDYSSSIMAKPMPLAPTISVTSDNPTYIRAEIISPESVHMYHLIRYVNGVQDEKTYSKQSAYSWFDLLNENDIVTFKAYVTLIINDQLVDSPISEMTNGKIGVTLKNQTVSQGGTLTFKVDGVVLSDLKAFVSDDLTVEAILDPGYRVYEWVVNGSTLNHRNSTLLLENIRSNMTITADFVLIGDLSGDYQVTATDLARIRRFLAGLENISQKGRVGGDIDNNGTVSITDLVRLRRRLAGLE